MERKSEINIARAYRVPSTNNKRNSSGSLQATRLSIGRAYQQNDKIADNILENGTNIAANEVTKSKFINIYLGFKNVVASHTIKIPHASKCNFMETKGSKASVPVKVDTNFHGILNGHIHKSEVQSVESAVIGQKTSAGDNNRDANNISEVNVLVTSTDAFGTLKATMNDEIISITNDAQVISQQIYREASWSGVALNRFATDVNSIMRPAAAHFSSRTIQAYDLNVGKITNQFLTSLPPLSIEYMSDTTILCAESHFVSLYDLRSSKCLGRISPSKGFIYSLALPSSPVDGNSNDNNMDTSNILLATGEDRIVYGIDRRNWKIRHRWRAPLKYEAIQLLSSPTMATTCYAVGLDNDILCGKWKSGSSANATDTSYKNILFQNHHCGFRGDSRWIGVSIFNDKRDYNELSGDVIVGASESGSLYVVENADKMQ
jgi:hypothetical protein